MSRSLWFYGNQIDSSPSLRRIPSPATSSLLGRQIFFVLQKPDAFALLLDRSPQLPQLLQSSLQCPRLPFPGTNSKMFLVIGMISSRLLWISERHG